MKWTFYGKRISGVLTVFPENSYRFEDEVVGPDEVKAKRLKTIIGYGERRRTKGSTSLSDMLLFGIRDLMEKKDIDLKEIGAIIVCTVSQDYIMPPISCILQGELGLSEDVYCVDIQQACAGYVVGLQQACMVLEHLEGKKVLLCTGEILFRRSKEDEPRTEHPSFGGDVANITIVENCDSQDAIYANFYVDGKNREDLIIEDGGFRNPMTPEKIEQQISNIPCMGVQMNGTNVFNFVQRQIPLAVDALTKMAGVDVQQIDWFLFHQPNRFMLQKLAEKLDVPFEKMPMDVTERYGNSDSGTIPVVMTTDVADDILKNERLCCLSGFGGGLTWASMLMKIGPLKFCRNIVSDL